MPHVPGLCDICCDKLTGKPSPSGLCWDCHVSEAPARICVGCGAWSETVYCAECAKTATCPHGESLRSGCGRCDVESDFAFDAAREMGRPAPARGEARK